MIVQHHVKYKEIDGVDEIVLLTPKEHTKHKLDKGFAIPHEIVRAAHERSPRRKNNHKEYRRKLKIIQFSQALEPYVDLFERILYNPITGNVTYNACFKSSHGKSLYDVLLSKGV